MDRLAQKEKRNMDWVIDVEIQFPVKQVACPGADDAREYAKACLDKLVEMGLLNHYHVLSMPRKVDL